MHPQAQPEARLALVVPPKIPLEQIPTLSTPASGKQEDIPSSNPAPECLAERLTDDLLNERYDMYITTIYNTILSQQIL